MGSSSHGGERKGQLGPAVTVPMSGTHLKRDEGWDPIIKAQLVVRVFPTSIRVLLGRGFELSWRRKKMTVGTCCNSTYEWDPPKER